MRSITLLASELRDGIRFAFLRFPILAEQEARQGVRDAIPLFDTQKWHITPLETVLLGLFNFLSK